MVFDRLAEADFQSAARKAFWRKVIGWLTGESMALLAVEEVLARLPVKGQHDLGTRAVPINQIIGSEGRYRDFDRVFLPRQTHTRDRWVRIDRLYREDVPLPPVSLYEIGDVYFVRDGNHRVSVARERGQEFVDAYVTRIDVSVSLTADTSADDLYLKQEYALFLEQTHISDIRPGAVIELTQPGKYATLLEHIDAHRWYFSEKRGAEVPYGEAVASWYDNVYMPLVAIIREHETLREFPGRAEADLYLWIIEHQWYLREAYGGEVSMDLAARHFADGYSHRLARRLRNLLKRLTRKRRAD